jgi:hypothetical protein
MFCLRKIRIHARVEFKIGSAIAAAVSRRASILGSTPRRDDAQTDSGLRRPAGQAQTASKPPELQKLAPKRLKSLSR